MKSQGNSKFYEEVMSDEIDFCEKELTLDEALSRSGFGKWNLFIIIFIGLIESCDSMEVMILSFLGPVLGCDWHITTTEESLITTSVFFGMLIGGIVIGWLSDIFGRRVCLGVGFYFLIYISLLASLSPTLVWIIINRTIIGFVLGGSLTITSTYITEITLPEYRGMLIAILFGFWTIGSYLITTIFMLIEPYFGWRVFLAVSIIPLFIIVPGFCFMPESPNFLLLKNKTDEAVDVVNIFAKSNKKPEIKSIIHKKVQNYSMTDLVHPKYLSTFIIINIVWFIDGISYYGVVLLSTIISSIPHQCLQNMSRASNDLQIGCNISDNSCCSVISKDSLINSYSSITGELVFLFITIILLKYFSRKLVMILLSSMSIVCLFLLNFCMPSLYLNMLLLILRGSSIYLYTVTVIYTSEVFPTSVRCLATGISNGFGRVGGMIAPFVINLVFVRWSFLYGTAIYIALNFVIIVCIIILPYETKNCQLNQTADEASFIEIDKHKYILVE